MGTEEGFWDKAAEKYAKRPVKDQDAYRKTLDRTRSHLAAGDSVLEVECGTGTTALLLADSVRHLTASDISARMIDIARTKAKAQQVENVSFVRAALFDETDMTGLFDAVLAFNLLHLLRDTQGAVRRVGELLKPGGLFISKTVCLSERSRHWRIPIYVMEKLGFAPYVRFLGIRELEDLITDAGFRIIETGVYPASPPSRFIVARKV